jgi:hypothetical protein
LCSRTVLLNFRFNDLPTPPQVDPLIAKNELSKWHNEIPRRIIVLEVIAHVVINNEAETSTLSSITLEIPKMVANDENTNWRFCWRVLIIKIHSAATCRKNSKKRVMSFVWRRVSVV